MMKVAVFLLASAASGLANCSPNAAHDQPNKVESSARMESGGEETNVMPGESATVDHNIPSVDNDARSRMNNDGTPKIVGGTLVIGTAFADTVGITPAGSTAIKCTGTLIDHDVVLTAGHCACAAINGRVFVGNDVPGGGTFYTVSRTIHGLKTVAGSNGQQCAVSLGLKERRDLAVLLLDRTVSGVTPRAIADDAIVDGATGFRAVGFGATDRDANVYPRQKREAHIVATSRHCNEGTGNQADEAVYGCQPGQEIVAGAVRDNHDTCKGDSGGPLLVNPQGDGHGPPAAYKLAGVTSRATSLAESTCGDGGIYERLDASGRDWVRRAIAAARTHP